jgi:hypothetical protein
MSTNHGSKPQVFVGLDYHQHQVQVCVLDAAGKVLMNYTAPNEWRAITQVADRCGGVQRAAIEACCGAADLAEQLVEYAGWSVQLAHAGYVARLKRSPDKTDFGDARPPGVAGGLNARGLSAGGVAGVVVGA